MYNNNVQVVAKTDHIHIPVWNLNVNESVDGAEAPVCMLKVSVVWFCAAAAAAAAADDDDDDDDVVLILMLLILLILQSLLISSFLKLSLAFTFLQGMSKPSLFSLGVTATTYSIIASDR